MRPPPLDVAHRLKSKLWSNADVAEIPPMRGRLNQNFPFLQEIDKGSARVWGSGFSASGQVEGFKYFSFYYIALNPKPWVLYGHPRMLDPTACGLLIGMSGACWLS